MRSLRSKSAASRTACRLAAILESSEHAVIGITPEGFITDWNDSAEQVYGYSARQACGKPIASLLFPKRMEEWERLAASFKRGETTKAHETSSQTKDEKAIAISMTLVPIRDVGGGVIGAWMTSRDIAERNRTHEEHFFRSALLAAQQETCRDGVLVVDQNGRMISWNRRFVELWGLESEILASGDDEHAVQSVLHKLVQPERFLARIKHLYEHREEQSLDELALTDGRFLERYSSPIFGDAGRYYGRVWYFRDVTVLKRSVEQARRATEELQRSNEELELFASIASHDLQAPLRKISAFGDLLKEKYAHSLDAAGSDYLAKIQQAAARMSVLIQALLQFASIKSTPDAFQGVDLSAVVHGVLADLETQAAQSDAHIDVGPLPVVKGNPIEMRQLFQNLLTNALKFRRAGTPAKIRVRAETTAATAQIFIEDNGVGIAQTDLPLLFQPFRRLLPGSYEGTGMGLAICQRIVLRHKGEIEATSSPGEGSTFRVRLPLADDAARPPRQAGTRGGADA